MNELNKMTPDDYGIYGRNVARWFDVAKHPHWPGPVYHHAHSADCVTFATLARVPAALIVRAALELGEPLMREQMECLADPARVDEALDMIDDWEARLTVSSTLRGDIAAWLVEPLAAPGFDVISTGGGMTALYKPCHASMREGAHILITDTDGAAIPLARERCVLVGLYDGDNQQIACEEVSMSGVPATIMEFERCVS
jgi:hypothetical protein